MRRKRASIPLHNWSSVYSEGVTISRGLFEAAGDEDVERPHRDDWHLFILQESGTTAMEIDFQRVEIAPMSVIYIHPSQVHRLISFHEAVISSWAINNENLEPEYLQILEELTPVQALSLDRETFAVIADTALLGLRYAERKHEALFNALMRDNCNTLAALVASQYLAQGKQANRSSRFEVIAKSFKIVLEQNFKIHKSPKTYAQQLNISTAYLNECVKGATGHSVSHHIQHRVVLEAERLLYHSNRSVKEIAAELGYDDYNYFSRLFGRVAGITPLSFRNKNHE